MWKDPIVDETRKVREAHAARFNYNLQAIHRDLKEQESSSKRTFFSYLSRICQSVAKKGTTNKAN